MIARSALGASTRRAPHDSRGARWLSCELVLESAHAEQTSVVGMFDHSADHDGTTTLVCAPMRLSGGGGSVSNAAARAHLKVRERSDWDADTLWVDLDARHFEFVGRAFGGDDSLAIIQATLECLKATAGRDDSLRYLRVRVLGAPVFRVLGGVFPLKDYRSGPQNPAVLIAVRFEVRFASMSPRPSNHSASSRSAGSVHFSCTRSNHARTLSAWKLRPWPRTTAYRSLLHTSPDIVRD